MNEEIDAIGFLIVQTLTANGALPVENAIVYVYSYGDENSSDGSRALYTLKTDNFGRTEKVALGALNKELSLTPEDKKPYTTYNIVINADGFYESERINVPIFQGITSVQTVDLIPLSEYSDQYSATPDSLNRFARVPDERI